MPFPPIKIGHHTIGSEHPPFIIAEMSGNHNQSLERALEIVTAAASAGCHALKIQTYTADTMTLNVSEETFLITDKDSPWKGRSLYELYQEAFTPWEWHEKIFSHARKLGLVAFSTPFYESAVDFLETLNVPAYKIASFELTHLPLIRRVARTGKPIIMSTGMASLEEISQAVSVVRAEKNESLVLLKCTSTYPASPGESNILTIPDLRSQFLCHVGLSDHTLGIGVSIAATALGAAVIEKHLTLLRADKGVDSTFSLEPSEMKQLVDECLKAKNALGVVSYAASEKESKSLKFRRSIFAARDIEQGENFSSQNVRIIRPSNGLEPKHYDTVLKKKAKVKIKRGHPLSWDLIE